MPNRSAIISPHLSPRRAVAAQREKVRLIDFCALMNITPEPAAVALYLSHTLGESSPSGRQIRTRLQLLDLAAILEGKSPWSKDPTITSFLQGLHRSAPLTSSARAEPLYLELVHALVDATMATTYDQLRDTATLLLADATGLPNSILAQLRWRDLRFQSNCVELTLPPHQYLRLRNLTIHLKPDADKRISVTAVLQQLRRYGDAGDALVLGSRWGPPDVVRVGRIVQGLPSTNPHPTPWTRAPASQLATLVTDLLAPAAKQLRDRAVLLIGYGAALRSKEATSLAQEDVGVVPEGLQILVQGRREPAILPRALDPQYCPHRAWLKWIECLDQARTQPGKPAFLQTSGAKVWDSHLNPSGLNYLIHQRCTEAQIHGHYTFTSLRSGHIRDRIRTKAQEHVIASQSGLTSLQSVERHASREKLLTDNVAGSIGL